MASSPPLPSPVRCSHHQGACDRVNRSNWLARLRTRTTRPPPLPPFPAALPPDAPPCRPSLPLPQCNDALCAQCRDLLGLACLTCVEGYALNADGDCLDASTPAGNQPSFILFSVDGSMIPERFAPAYDEVIAKLQQRNPNGCRPPLTWFASKQGRNETDCEVVMQVRACEGELGGGPCSSPSHAGDGQAAGQSCIRGWQRQQGHTHHAARRRVVASCVLHPPALAGLQPWP